MTIGGVLPNESLGGVLSPGLRAWKIEHAACGEIKRVLDASAINEASLFPDLDGLSRYIGWLYKWGKFRRTRAQHPLPHIVW